MEVKGTLLAIQPIKVVSDKFKACDIWVETLDKYPQTLAIQLTNENCDNFKVPLGAQVTLNINLKGREWTSPQGEKKVFNTIECWKWSSDAQEQPQAAINTDDDLLPF